MLGARGVDDVDVEIPVDDVSKHGVGLVSVGVLSNPVVGGRAIELRKEEFCVPLAVEERAREEHFKATVKTAAVAHSAFVGIPASGFGRGFYRVQVAPAFCDDVDNRGESSCSVNRRVRSPNDLDALNQIDIDREFCTHISSVENVVVYPMAIEQEENACVVVPGPREPSYSHVGVVSVVNYVEAANTAQYIRQRPIAVFLYFFCGNYGHRDGRVGSFLQELRRTVDCVHLEFRKFFNTQCAQVRLL